METNINEMDLCIITMYDMCILYVYMICYVSCTMKSLDRYGKLCYNETV